MSHYRRQLAPGGCFFFTLVCHKRQKIFANKSNINRLRTAFRQVKLKHPFNIDAIVLLPDHLHCIWQLPEDDSNYSLRWRLIKHFVATGVSASRNHRNEKQIWQRRFWEHSIRDQNDWQKHMDYIHYNPVKHGYVSRPEAWQYSSFSMAVQKGWYDKGWGASPPESIDGLNFE